MEGQVDKVSDI